MRTNPTFYHHLDIYSNNILIISLIHSHCPLSLWKDGNLGIFLNEERKACLLITDGSFVHEQIAIFKARSQD